MKKDEKLKAKQQLKMNIKNQKKKKKRGLIVFWGKGKLFSRRSEAAFSVQLQRILPARNAAKHDRMKQWGLQRFVAVWYL